MLLAVAIAGLAGQSGLVASDYFPTVPGTKWTYSDTKEPGTTITKIAEQSTNIGDANSPVIAVPVDTLKDGQNVETIYYTVQDSRVAIVMYKRPNDKAASPLKDSTTVIGTGPHGAWEDVQNIAVAIDPEPLTIDGSSRSVPAQTVFGEKRDMLEVDLYASVRDKNQYSVHQKCLYAKGVGLIEMDEKTRASGKDFSRVLKLTSFVPGTPK